MTPKELKARSKFLSYILRHKPETLDLTMDPQGWVAIDQIIVSSTQPVSHDQILEIARSNSKQRFAISADGQSIRANQGHSIPIDLGLPACEPPEILYHGTALANLAPILAHGLNRQARHHVHLSPDTETARNVGMRHGKPVVLMVKASQMHQAGFEFLLTQNGVWLCDAVPPEYLRQ